MKQKTAKMLLGDLLGSKIVTAEGKRIGHVQDIQLTTGPDYAVKALMYGRRGLAHRLHWLNPFRKKTLRPLKPDSIPWEAVDSCEPPIVRLKPGFDVRKEYAEKEEGKEIRAGKE